MCARCLKEGGLFNPASKPLKKRKATVQETSTPAFRHQLTCDAASDHRRLRLLPLGVLLLSLALGFMSPSKAEVH